MNEVLRRRQLSELKTVVEEDVVREQSRKVSLTFSSSNLFFLCDLWF